MRKQTRTESEGLASDTTACRLIVSPRYTVTLSSPERSIREAPSELPLAFDVLPSGDSVGSIDGGEEAEEEAFGRLMCRGNGPCISCTERTGSLSMGSTSVVVCSTCAP